LLYPQIVAVNPVRQIIPDVQTEGNWFFPKARKDKGNDIVQQAGQSVFNWRYYELPRLDFGNVQNIVYYT
jgi:hypothetical protein